MSDQINQWDGATDAGSEWARLRRQGYSHNEAIAIIEGTDLKSVTNYFSNHDLSDLNLLETAIEVDEIHVDMIIIDIYVYYPFPNVAGISVVAHDGMNDVALLDLDPTIDSNLDHYGRCMGSFRGAF